MEQVGQNVFKLRQKVAKKLEKVSERLDNTEETAGQEEVISRREFGKMLGLGSAAGAGALMFSDAARAATTVDPDFLSLDDGGDLRFGDGNDFELRYDSGNSQLELVGNNPVWTVSKDGNLNVENRELDLGSGNITGVGNVDGVDISSHASSSSAHHVKTTSLSGLNDVTGVESFERNTSGNRPSAGTQGRIYFETDTGRVLYDKGTSWIEIGVTTHNQLDTIGTEDHHSPGTHMEKNGTDFDVTPSTIDATDLDGSSGTAGQVLKTDGSATSWGTTSSVSVPVGGIIAWDKSRNNTPSLPANYAECNGQTVSDSDSPYDGQTLPDLNGNNRFLRGNSSSGGTGGSANNTHNHKWFGATSDPGDDYTHLKYNEDREGWNNVWDSNGNAMNLPGDESGQLSDEVWTKNETLDNEPPYYNVVHVMRIK